MALSELQLAQVNRLLSPLCKDSPDPAVHAQLRHGYRVEGNRVILFGSRIRWDDHSQWLEHPVAQFRYVTSIGRWRLFCQFRDLKWHGYEPLPEAPDLATLVAEVRRDPTGIFWG